jgi:WD40 repeat protein
MIARVCAALALIAGLAGCAAPPDTVSTPTVLPYLSSAAPITVENVAQITQLGQLTQPNVTTSLFSHSISPDGTRLIALNNEEAIGWDLLTGALAFNTARSEATRIFYSADKTEVYAIQPNGEVVVYSAETGGQISRFLGHAQFGGVIAFAADAGYMVLGGTDGTLKVWDTFARQSLSTVTAHTAPILVLDISPDATRVVTASGDGFARVWDWQARTLIAELALDDTLPTSIAYAPDSTQIAIGTERDLRLWSTEDPSLSRQIQGVSSGITTLRYAPSGDYLLSGNANEGLALWNPRTAESVGTLPDVGGLSVDAEFSPDGSLLITTQLTNMGSRETAPAGDVFLWDLSTVDENGLTQARLPLSSAITEVTWTQDSRLLLFFEALGPVMVWGIAG